MILPTTLSTHQRDLPRPRARHRLRGLGLDDRRHGRGRAPAGRLADDRLLVALGLRDQRAARHPDRHRRAADAVAESRDSERTGRSTWSAPCSRWSRAPRSSSPSSRAAPYGWWRPTTAPSIGDWTWPWAISPDPVRVRRRPRRHRRLHRCGGATRERRGRSTLIAFSLFAHPLVPQRQHRGDGGLARRVRHHPVAAAVAAVRDRASMPLQTGLRAAGAGDRIVRRERRRRCRPAARIAPVTIVRVGLAAEIVGVAGVGFVVGGRHRHGAGWCRSSSSTGSESGSRPRS